MAQPSDKLRKHVTMANQYCLQRAAYPSQICESFFDTKNNHMSHFLVVDVDLATFCYRVFIFDHIQICTSSSTCAKVLECITCAAQLANQRTWLGVSFFIVERKLVSRHHNFYH